LSMPRALSRMLSSNYHETVIDHYENPRNVGSLDKTKKNVGTGLVGAPACGDVMKLQVELNEDGTTIERAVFKVELPIT
jgi:iron-sulfur cluster assembly enzyme ISCU, mitochondrial